MYIYIYIYILVFIFYTTLVQFTHIVQSCTRLPFNKKLEEIKKKLIEAQEEIFNAVQLADDPLTALESRISQDIAKCWPDMKSMDKDDSKTIKPTEVLQHVALITPKSFNIDKSTLLKHIERLIPNRTTTEYEYDDECKEEDRLGIHIGNTFANEFTSNDKILTGGFPDLFPLGLNTSSLGPGSLDDAITSQLLRLYDPRFAEDHNLIFILFNQRLRYNVV